MPTPTTDELANALNCINSRGRLGGNTITTCLELFANSGSYITKDVGWIDRKKKKPISIPGGTSKDLDPEKTYVVPHHIQDIEHWTLLMIKGYQVDFYDSLEDEERTISVRDHVMDFLTQRLDCTEEDVSFCPHRGIIQQRDKTSCGLFVLMYAWCLIQLKKKIEEINPAIPPKLKDVRQIFRGQIQLAQRELEK